MRTTGVRDFLSCVSVCPCRWAGRTVKTEPLPGSLATVTSPPIMRALAGPQSRGLDAPFHREAGMVFALTKPKLAAFTHVVQLASDRIPPPTLDDMVAETRQTYDGPLQIGEDLMCFEIGDRITVRRY
jgi:hypothetical protein